MSFESGFKQSSIMVPECELASLEGDQVGSLPLACLSFNVRHEKRATEGSAARQRQEVDATAIQDPAKTLLRLMF